LRHIDEAAHQLESIEELIEEDEKNV